MKKFKITVLLLLALSTMLVGCTDSQAALENNTQSNESPSENDRYDGLAGKIIKIENENVHIKTGDIIEIVKVSPEISKNFYIGESVKVNLEDDKYNLESFIIEDFSRKNTNMGNPIVTITGTVESIAEGNIFTLNTDGNIYEFMTSSERNISKGSNVTVEYMEIEEKKYLVALYNNDIKLELTITSIERSKTGRMILKTKDNNGKEISIFIHNATITEFNHSQLQINDNIIVYPGSNSEPNAASIQAQRIILN